MKRFWDKAEPQADAAGWVIHLDGRPVRLPGGPILSVPRAPLADAIAVEWRAAGERKGGEMSWHDVPLTRLAGTAQERILPDPGPVAEGIARYGESDLLCYRATHPQPLVQRQEHAWQPLLDWAADTYAAPLRVSAGITHVAQDPVALAALHRAVQAHDPWELAALGLAVPDLGSVVLGLALSAGRITAADAHRLATLDEAWQEEQWGQDDEATARRANQARDIALAGRFLALHRGNA